METIIDSGIFQLLFSGGVIIAQLYIATKIIPLKKDVETLRRDIERINAELNEMFKRCYENHKHH